MDKAAGGGADEVKANIKELILVGLLVSPLAFGYLSVAYYSILEIRKTGGVPLLYTALSLAWLVFLVARSKDN